MDRPTIPDLAKAAGVSVSTVNRVIASEGNVSAIKRAAVQEAAERIGFYGVAAIQSRVSASRLKLRFGALLLQPHRPFYQNVATALREAAAEVSDADIEMRIEFLENLSPQATADAARALAEKCHAIAITSAVHPQITQAVEEIAAKGVHVFAFITQLSAAGQMHYIGLDNWKVGRTSAWTIANHCKASGKIGIITGSHRYRNQEMKEIGFRSYFRENEPDFTLLEPLSTYESSAVAQEVTEKLLTDHPDLAGLYITGGGISGAIAALQARKSAAKLVVVGDELTEITRAALLDGTLTLVISHPLDRMARDLIRGMVKASTTHHGGNWSSVTAFDMHNRENI